jgi:hypothetical protein
MNIDYRSLPAGSTGYPLRMPSLAPPGQVHGVPGYARPPHLDYSAYTERARIARKSVESAFKLDLRVFGSVPKSLA